MLVIKIFSERKKTLGGSGCESFWEEGADFEVDVLRFHTCLTDILDFLEKLEWWFEQDVDDEEEKDEECEGSSETREKTLDDEEMFWNRDEELE
uniref:Uncharacterized protein n=1 Tax=Tanacetum cinerariifolium TaxID=118510 RepID=A0A6L2NNH8_TANCI|nr:hypothetical protein [Tanacetum cinerariifolium]